MSSRESLWYCHNCHAEMRPLMHNGEPICASCRGGFVEKMENPEDDPRGFVAADPFDGRDTADDTFDNFMTELQTLLGNHGRQRHRQRAPSPSPTDTPQPGFTIRINGGADGRAFSFGTVRTPEAEGIRDPRNQTSGNDGSIAGQLMMQYLTSMLGGRAGGFSPGGGRMGDYVFSQEALDEVITQIMENSNSSRPVAASDQIIDDLPREVLEIGSHTLEKDCAVCKDQFKLETDDPDEQVVVTLPCKHPFHEGCILPWLKSSGTCPVCRFALVSQPEQHGPPQPAASGSHSGRRSPPGRQENQPGIISSIFGRLSGSSAQQSYQDNVRGGSRPSAQRRGSGNNSGGRNVPGGWGDLD